MAKILFLIFNIFVVNYPVSCLLQHHQIKRTVSNPLWNETSLDKLRNNLLINYDKYAKPNEFYITTNVKMELSFLYLATHELNSTFTSSIWLHLSWKDPKLVWDPHNYDGLDLLKMADHEIWQPDIYLFNSASTGGDPIIRYGNPHALVNPDGTVHWEVPLKFTALCEFDMYYWPFDTQYCYLRFGSATRPGKDIRLEIENFRHKSPTIVSQWKVSCASGIVPAQRPHYLDSFYHAIFNITLTRKSSSITTVVSAVIFVSVCLVLTERFCLFKNGKAFILPCVTALVLCMFLIYFGSIVAPKRSVAPWIVTFLSTCLFLNTFSLMESIFVVYVFKFMNKENISWRVKTFLNGKLRKVLFLSDCILQCNRCARRSSHDDVKILQRAEDESKKSQNCSTTHEWELLVIAIDRILFIVYTFIIAVSLLAYVL